MQSCARRSLLALLLLVPVPSIGSALYMLVPETRGTPLGQAAFIGAKVWILALPALWLWLVERRKFSLSPARNGGLLVGAVLGVLISVIIYATYLLVGPTLIDPSIIRGMAAQTGLDRLWFYIASTVLFCTVNAVLEEYVWRWFVFRRCEDAMPRWAAVLASAAMFTAHHVIVLKAQFDLPIVALGSFGVFVGGAVWSWCYLKYRSVWPGYVSHALVDVTIFVLGYQLIFGS